MIGTSELFIIAFAALLLFGPERLPEFAKRYGKAIKEIREALEKADLSG